MAITAMNQSSYFPTFLHSCFIFISNTNQQHSKWMIFWSLLLVGWWDGWTDTRKSVIFSVIDEISRFSFWWIAATSHLFIRSFPVVEGKKSFDLVSQWYIANDSYHTTFNSLLCHLMFHLFQLRAHKKRLRLRRSNGKKL